MISVSLASSGRRPRLLMSGSRVPVLRITTDEAGIFASELRAIGLDYVCVSSSGISPQARPAVAPGVPGAARRRGEKASGIAVRAVGMTASPHQAEAIVADGPRRFCCVAARVSRRPAMGLACRWCAWRRCRLPAAISSRASRKLAGRRAGVRPTVRGIKQQVVASRNGCARPTISGRRAVEAAATRSKRPRRRGCAPPPRGRAMPSRRTNSSEWMPIVSKIACK
jgi:hypothetical protein